MGVWKLQRSAIFAVFFARIQNFRHIFIEISAKNTFLSHAKCVDAPRRPSHWSQEFLVLEIPDDPRDF